MLTRREWLALMIAAGLLVPASSAMADDDDDRDDRDDDDDDDDRDDRDDDRDDDD